MVAVVPIDISSFGLHEVQNLHTTSVRRSASRDLCCSEWCLHSALTASSDLTHCKALDYQLSLHLVFTTASDS